MGNSLITALFAPKRDLYFEVAMQAVNSMKTLLALKGESFDELDWSDAIFHKVYKNDPNSPSVYFIEEKQWLVFYPPNSTPYIHKLGDKIKFVEILSGVLYDRNSNHKWFKGDKLKVYPTDNFIPHTKGEKCVIRVCVGDMNSIWDNVCG